MAHFAMLRLSAALFGSGDKEKGDFFLEKALQHVQRKTDTALFSSSPCVRPCDMVQYIRSHPSGERLNEWGLNLEQTRKKGILLFLLILVGLVGLLSGCGGRAEPNQHSDSGETIQNPAVSITEAEPDKEDDVETETKLLPEMTAETETTVETETTGAEPTGTIELYQLAPESQSLMRYLNSSLGNRTKWTAALLHF